MNKLKINIDKKITEQILMENCLNQISSGYDSTFLLCLYALEKGWDKDKLLYYLNLLKENR